MKTSHNTINEKEILLSNLDKLHTTSLGVERIQRNLALGNIDVVELCKRKIESPDCTVSRCGKNWYCETDGMLFTVNASSYTIITAKLLPANLRK
ncbi:MAG: DUF3781 domain-containing protein [Bacteroidales bacterium]|nr:DUF3781 domain-containing protein [Bacteroidales bacterium]